MSEFEFDEDIEVSMSQNFTTKFKAQYLGAYLDGKVPLFEVWLTEQNFSCCFLHARKIEPMVTVWFSLDDTLSNVGRLIPKSLADKIKAGDV
tara:strand:+ start:176 stop:451 length:276 start_codon:yes stop_codon:yes gene_type:complete